MVYRNKVGPLVLETHVTGWGWAMITINYQRKLGDGFRKRPVTILMKEEWGIFDYRPSYEDRIIFRERHRQAVLRLRRHIESFGWKARLVWWLHELIPLG